MVMNNLHYLEALLNVPPEGKKSKHKKTTISSRFTHTPRTFPLFRVNASLSAPEIVISPQSQEVYKMMLKFVRSIVDSSKHFHRWLNGTCILAPPQKVNDEEEPFVFSFHSDLVQNQNVITLVNSVNSNVSRTFSNLHKWIDTWKKYRPLWKVDKVVTLEKFAQKNPSVIMYDEKLILYAKLSKDVESQPSLKDFAFVRVLTTPLQSAINAEAIGWVNSIGNQ